MSSSNSEAAIWRLEDIREGQRVKQGYAITPAVYEAFLVAFGDRNPLHVDDAFARQRGFTGRVMHGAILNGFISHFIGMVFPGRHALLLGVDVRFQKALALGDALVLEVEVKHVARSHGVVQLDFRFTAPDRPLAIASGRVQVKVQDEPRR